MGKKQQYNVNKKLFILVSKEDTVIRFVIAICHDPHEELLFLSVSQNALLSFLSYWLLKSFAFYSLLSLLFYEVCRVACLCDTCGSSHLHDVRSPVEVLPEGLSFIQLRKSHWTTASMYPARLRNTTRLSSSVCVCVCMCVLRVLVWVHFGVFVREKAWCA